MMMIQLMTAVAMTAVEMPPKRYAHEPTTPYTVTYLDHDATQKACAAQLAWAFIHGQRDAVALGCTVFRRDKIPAVYIDKDLPDAVKDAVLVHEKGHVNGWLH